jgi:hypothetical protein
MARQKPNKTSKPPHKQTEEQDKQPNTDPSTNITPKSAKARKKTTGTIEQSENPQTKTFRTPTQAILVNNDPTLNPMDKLEREEELKRQEEALYQDDDESLRTVDKFEHGNTNTKYNTKRNSRRHRTTQNTTRKPGKHNPDNRQRHLRSRLSTPTHKPTTTA